MNLLLHMAYIVVLDWVCFQYLYRYANRFTVLNVHETAFLPERYLISGLVVGVFVYWLYLVPVRLLQRFTTWYWHPRWWLLWCGTAVISSIQVMQIVRNNEPILEVGAAIGLVVHLQLVHFMMLMIAQRVFERSEGTILPGVRSAIVFMGMWLFWLWYSFENPNTDLNPAEVGPLPQIGSPTEGFVIIGIVVSLMVVGVSFRLERGTAYLQRQRVLFSLVTLEDVLDAFYAAWGLYFLVVPAGHFLMRHYIISHSTIFPTVFEWALAPLMWSLVGLWLILALSKRQRIAVLGRQWIARRLQTTD